MGEITGGVQRRATAAVAVLIAILAALLLAAPAGAAATGPADQGRTVVTSAAQASAGSQVTPESQAAATSQAAPESQVTPESPAASDRLDVLPPLRHHLVKAAVARHRGGGHPLSAALGRAAVFLLPAGAFLLLHRCARATQALPGRLALSYPMRT